MTVCIVVRNHTNLSIAVDVNKRLTPCLQKANTCIGTISVNISSTSFHIVRRFILKVLNRGRVALTAFEFKTQVVGHALQVP